MRAAFWQWVGRVAVRAARYALGHPDQVINVAKQIGMN